MNIKTGQQKQSIVNYSGIHTKNNDNDYKLGDIVYLES